MSKQDRIDPIERWVLVFLAVAAVLFFLSSCQAGPISGAAIGAIAALDQMMARGAISPEEYQALRGSLGGFSMPEVVGTLAGVAGATGLGILKARNSAVARVMKLRGPTEAERRQNQRGTS
mgnify:CR=1 FL=1